MTLDGKDVSRDNATGHWRWVILEKPGEMRLEMTTGSRENYALKLDTAAKRMTLTRNLKDPQGKPVLNAAGRPQKDSNWRGDFSFKEPEKDMLVLDGTLDGHPTHAKLAKMPLIGKGFHWVLDPPKEIRSAK
jgi:hypothetical protein